MTNLCEKSGFSVHLYFLANKSEIISSFHFKSIFDTFPHLKLLPESENQLYEWKGSLRRTRNKRKNPNNLIKSTR